MVKANQSNQSLLEMSKILELKKRALRWTTWLK
jgi:hypothetical protein